MDKFVYLQMYCSDFFDKMGLLIIYSYTWQFTGTMLTVKESGKIMLYKQYIGSKKKYWTFIAWLGIVSIQVNYGLIELTTVSSDLC